MRHRLVPSMVGISLAVVTSIATACPFCDGGPTGSNQVREIIFGDDFWFHLAAVALPFVLVLIVPVVLQWCRPAARWS